MPSAHWRRAGYGCKDVLHSRARVQIWLPQPAGRSAVLYLHVRRNVRPPVTAQQVRVGRYVEEYAAPALICVPRSVSLHRLNAGLLDKFINGSHGHRVSNSGGKRTECALASVKLSGVGARLRASLVTGSCTRHRGNLMTAAGHAVRACVVMVRGRLAQRRMGAEVAPKGCGLHRRTVLTVQPVRVQRWLPKVAVSTGGPSSLCSRSARHIHPPATAVRQRDDLLLYLRVYPRGSTNASTPHHRQAEGLPHATAERGALWCCKGAWHVATLVEQWHSAPASGQTLADSLHHAAAVTGGLWFLDGLEDGRSCGCAVDVCVVLLAFLACISGALVQAWIAERRGVSGALHLQVALRIACVDANAVVTWRFGLLCVTECLARGVYVNTVHPSADETLLT
ncbi:LOW QUALITY PROTEIN: uncharacterized protein EMH_0050290 [Eimeria mitis]|uniref:Uncharacterized protein n=1 Tax=Eimeria mitis TaxID=44415 RepID=U6JXP6_9EIME|nr:LOW QUALITY PROTEIN: uncharacterized protein EMH_0050290 [Eimeria mitis]CDJ29516.1 hypothetical protein EMH_0050290 [Eimeria mitis]